MIQGTVTSNYTWAIEWTYAWEFGVDLWGAVMTPETSGKLEGRS
jgi:hypothetical protein